MTDPSKNPDDPSARTAQAGKGCAQDEKQLAPKVEGRKQQEAKPNEGPEPNPPDSGLIPPILRPILRLDVAFILAIFSGACYVAGQFAILRDADELSLPAHLLPDTPIQALLAVGAFRIALLAAVALLVYCLVYLASKALPATWGQAIQEYARKRYAQHPIVYAAVGVIAILVLLKFISYMPLRSNWPYADERLPSVVTLELKHERPKLDKNKLLYLSHRDKVIVLKRAGRKEYVFIQEDELALLEFAPK